MAGKAARRRHPQRTLCRIGTTSCRYRSTAALAGAYLEWQALEGSFERRHLAVGRDEECEGFNTQIREKLNPAWSISARSKYKATNKRI
jgi:hypothetical protein